MDIAKLIRRGGVLNNINANDIFEVYEQICPKMSLPESVTPAQLYEGLCNREKTMSTAVGHGVALPHCRDVILKNEDEQQITVVYLKHPIDMNAQDGRKVDVLFVLLTSNSQTHLQVLSGLAGLFKNDAFNELLNKRAGAEELAQACSVSELRA